MLFAAKTIRKKENEVWRLARKAPMFLKASTIEVETAKGKVQKTVYRRSQRLINSQAYIVMMSGAANYVSAVLQKAGKSFREKVDGEGRSPWLPGISPGAAAALEQFLCAYTQQAVFNAANVRKGLSDGKTKRLNEKMMQIGFDVTNEDVFGAFSLAPRAIACAPELKVIKGKKHEDKDFVPEEQEEDAEDAEDAEDEAPNADSED
jgi:hypothetical protein